MHNDKEHIHNPMPILKVSSEKCDLAADIRVRHLFKITDSSRITKCWPVCHLKEYSKHPWCSEVHQTLYCAPDQQ